ncbi:MAG TPA: LuxR C-terminal-related transcriptional regulator, partial [Thermomicrobiales bacterium]|nr:LuxR C-terminal-related transcriptional regulator [Thermomicrobiales bacterium]
NPDRIRKTIDEIAEKAETGRDDVSLVRLLWARSAQVILSRHTGSITQYGNLAAGMLAQAERLGLRRLAAQAEYYCGAAAFERNHLELAAEHLRRGFSEPASGMTFHVWSGCLLVECLDLMGDPRGAGRVLESLNDRVRYSSMTGFLPKLRQVAAGMATRRGESPPDLAAIQHALLSHSTWAMREAEGPPLGFLAPLIGDAMNWRREKALQTVASVMETARINHLPGPLIGGDIMLAWHEYLEGRHADAHARLGAALARANELGRVRTVIGLGDFVLTLLEWHSRAGHGTEYVDFLIESMEHEQDVRHGARHATNLEEADRSNSGGSGPVDSLTNRELDVLHGLARRLSNKEIGDELSISHLTVKSHTRTLYAKLDVSGRRQAIARARELGHIE